MDGELSIYMYIWFAVTPCGIFTCQVEFVLKELSCFFLLLPSRCSGVRETSQFWKELSCFYLLPGADGIENRLGLLLKLIGSYNCTVAEKSKSIFIIFVLPDHPSTCLSGSPGSIIVGARDERQPWFILGHAIKGMGTTGNYSKLLVKTYLLTSNGELLMVLNIVGNGSLWRNVVFKKEVITHSMTNWVKMFQDLLF